MAAQLTIARTLFRKPKSVPNYYCKCAQDTTVTVQLNSKIHLTMGSPGANSDELVGYHPEHWDAKLLNLDDRTVSILRQATADPRLDTQKPVALPKEGSESVKLAEARAPSYRVLRCFLLGVLGIYWACSSHSEQFGMRSH